MNKDDKSIDIDKLENDNATKFLVDDSFKDNFDDEGSTSETSATHVASSAEMREAMNGFRSDKRVRLLRDVALMLLLLSALFVSTGVYFSLTSSERREFENTFDDQATQVGHDLANQLEAKLRALDAFSVSITSYARQVSTNWPNITVPDFAERAASTLRASKGTALAIHPVVKGEDLMKWEEYAVQNQAWLEESLDFQSRQSPKVLGGSSTRNSAANVISQFVYRVVDGSPTEVDGSDTRLPLWEHFPSHDGLPPVNYDALSNRLHEDALDVVMDDGLPVLGLAFDVSKSFHGLAIDVLEDDFYLSNWSEIWSSTNTTDRDGERKLRKSYLDRTNPEAVIHKEDLDQLDGQLQHIPDERSRHSDNDGPAVNLWYPILSSSSENQTVVAVVSLTATLGSFIDASLSHFNGLVLVIANGCRQEMTFEFIDGEAIYLGPGDYHDPEFEDYRQRFDLILAEDVQLSSTFCPYRAFVYPSNRMSQEYASGMPPFFSILIATVFLFTIFVFMAYDYLVDRHQKNLAEKATRTTAIVSSLFPKIVRDRLFEEQTKASPLPKKRQFMNRPQLLSVQESSRNVNKVQGSIADLFPNTTVMFGDIAGFTAWSSSRQPSEVFMLLENLYGALDKIARAMDVFKVETIGDCYVAVTGLPSPQADHHLRMVRFARYALQKISVVTHDMEVSLGPDTANLGFRIGLHSGPVTAGVLRGEKSRFQLFGDTVNTASRMESLGNRNQIQVSQATADLIAASGKSHWMKKREELIEAKGKGKVQTYWIKTASKSSDGAESNDFDPQPEAAIHDIKHNVRQSLIDWQVELLSKLLKQIVLHRNLLQPTKSKPIKYMETSKSVPRDEIAEKISMPAFDPTKETSESMESVDLQQTVVRQLEDLIATYAGLYHDNHFHSFDHACHVTMSANKLLQRIVFRPNAENEFSKEAHDYTYGLASDPLTQFAIVFSAIVHDLDHSGVSNSQLTKENNRLAVMYGGKSVAEQNSVDLAFEVLISQSYSDLVSCICADEKEYIRFRQLVINCVMATDIFDKDLLSLRNSRWNKAFSCDDESASDLKATIVIEHIIQAADVAHTMQHWHVYQKWNEKLFAEMCAAYESGRGCEKNPATTWYEGELWFFDNYVIPLAKKLDDCGVFGVSSDECLNYAVQNRSEWASKGKEVVKQFSKKYSGTMSQ
ncbi:unnamed protein product [Cylindrotheca closterium]|uniref:Phosphodiesterase n=1 Tax=Cylindrotheca closterium TaxID=2856 RepID=A0AAD2G622_9STRA|nr:unnamed protein product [Cylindrotheca closterium]